MSAAATTPLFACSRCFSRHPFEELSPGEQLCKECRGSFPVVKCTYCRSEFQQTSKSNTSSICKKCEANVKSYGKPTACEYCNIIAAFIGNKCQRCTNSERKYGSAVTCEQCKQRCAFDRHDDSKKVSNEDFVCVACWNLSQQVLSGQLPADVRRVGHSRVCLRCGRSLAGQRVTHHLHTDTPRERAIYNVIAEWIIPRTVDGKLLCWLCTQSLKRALARTKQHMSSVDKHKHRSHKSKSGHKDKRKSDMSKSINATDSSMNDSQPLEKKTKLNPLQAFSGEFDPNSSDHVVAITTLKETIASLQKKVQQKDNELLSKDKLITELKAQNLTHTTELRSEMKNKERLNETKFNLMNTKIQNLLKEVATLSKSAKKNPKNTKTILANTENSGSGTDSPSTN